jgi:hypothetical protein
LRSAAKARGHLRHRATSEPVRTSTRAPLDDRDQHSRRVVFDTVEWHDRLVRLANIRRELNFLPTTVQNKQRPSRRNVDQVGQPPRLKNCTARSCFSAACRDAKLPRLRRFPVF